LNDQTNKKPEISRKIRPLRKKATKEEKPDQQKPAAVKDKSTKTEAPKKKSPKKPEPEKKVTAQQQGLTRLNKYIAAAGICSRREADELIKKGKVKVNGKIVTEMGVKVVESDKVRVEGHEIKPEEYVYLLLNKPKNTITTTSDERDRDTVMDLVKNATDARVFPVGRLDRNTTGLLILTNDGELANRLMHPSYKVRKVYQVETNDVMTDEQLTQLRNGVELEDGPARAYKIERHPVQKKKFRMSIIEGRNHQVKRMVSAVGSEVTSLKRIVYAGLTDKGLNQGRWRHLTRKEIFELRQLVKLLDKKSLKL